VTPVFDAANTLVALNIVAPMTPPPSIAALTRPAMTARFTLLFMSSLSCLCLFPFTGSTPLSSGTDRRT
jgi:hypothetical protein